MSQRRDERTDRTPTEKFRGGVAQTLGREFKSALARWVLKKRHEQREAGPPDPAEEATHIWDGRRRFAEDYTFAAVQKDWGLIMRLEWLPGRESHRVWVALLRPDGVATLANGQQVVRADGSDRWRAGGLELDCVRPYQRWGLRYVGRLTEPADGSGEGARCSIDLTFVSERAPFRPGIDDDPELVARHLGDANWDRALVRGVRRTLSRGYVQLGSLIGTVAYGDTLMPIRAECLRQHTWGVRDWGASDQAFQCFFSSVEDHSGFVHHAEFPFVTLEGGFVSKSEGAALPLRSVGASLERRPDQAPAQATLHLGHAHGGLELELTTVSETSIVVDGRGRIDFALCRVAPDGQALLVQQTRVLPRA